jgi:hypothetical protein
MENLTESTKPDILIGNESWLHKDIQSTEVFTSRYIPYRNDRKTYAHGGVFILVSEKYLSSEPSELKSEKLANNYESNCKSKGHLIYT